MGRGGGGGQRLGGACQSWSNWSLFAEAGQWVGAFRSAMVATARQACVGLSRPG